MLTFFLELSRAHYREQIGYHLLINLFTYVNKLINNCELLKRSFRLQKKYKAFAYSIKR